MLFQTTCRLNYKQQFSAAKSISLAESRNTLLSPNDTAKLAHFYEDI